MSSFTNSSAENFAFNSNPNNGISICIPRVFKNIPHWRIKKHFIDANLGFVERVDVIHVNPINKEGRGYKRAFVHFAAGKWNMRDQFARNVLKMLQEKKEVTLLYEDPWFWKLTISSSKRPDSAPQSLPTTIAINLAKRKVTQPKKKIDLDAPVNMSTVKADHLKKVESELENNEEEDPDYGKYKHLSEQAASLMMEQDKLEAQQREIKELSSY